MAANVFLLLLFAASIHCQDRIIGGTVVDPPHSRDFQVAIYVDDQGEGELPRFYCGGSVYDDTTVITAAHCCIYRVEEELIIVAGDHQISVDEGTEQVLLFRHFLCRLFIWKIFSQKRGVSEIKINEDFHYLRIENDICLLELDEPLELNEYENTFIYVPKKLTKHRYVGPVDLPEPLSPPPTPFATVSGWGSTEIGGPASDLLRQVTIPIIPDEECREDYIDLGSEFIFPG